MPRGEITGADNKNFWFHCLGCGDPHRIPFAGEGTLWEFNGDVERPTISPSILVKRVGGKHVCHSFVREGRIEYLSDCTHLYAGRATDLPEWTAEDSNYIVP